MGIEIRRLDPDKDRPLYEEVFQWDTDHPQWYQDLEKVAGLSFEEFMNQAADRADIGIFCGKDLTGLVAVLRRGAGIFEAHIWAKRRANLHTLAEAGSQIRASLECNLGMKAGFVWVAKKNRPIKRLCAMIGLLPDGAVVTDGMSHGKPIEWVRLST